MQVEMTKDRGLYSKPSAAVYPRALNAGTLLQYNPLASQIIRGFRRAGNPSSKAESCYSHLSLMTDKYYRA